MKVLLLLALVCVSVYSIPYIDQLCLINSLIVGKDDEKDLVNWNCKSCNEDNKPLRSHFIEEKAKDIKCVLSVYEDLIILAFRYTNTALNVWQDILYPLQIQDEHMCSTCKVQKAYSNMWDTIREDVIKELKQIQQQSAVTKLMITGISMGGGLSALSAVDIIYSNIFKTVDLVVFGSPRVGNKKWAEHFDNVITKGYTKRYILKGDPIVILPRCLTLLCNYGHVGIQIVCHEDLDLCVQDDNIPDDFGLKKLVHKFQIDSDIQKVYLGGGIDSHINSYPKLYDYTLQLNESTQKAIEA